MKNWLSEIASDEVPVAVLWIRKTVLTDSSTRLPPTQRPWSGGSSENWLPLSAFRWSRMFSPVMTVFASDDELTGRLDALARSPQAGARRSSCWTRRR